tara:strand:- start:2804 stop:2977 length:174 start_codon:yes stop_codon:yes gene_type:complete
LDHPLCGLMVIDFDDFSQQQPINEGLIRNPRASKRVTVLNFDAVPVVKLPRPNLIER